MIQWQIDIGQIIISFLLLLLAMVAWFIKREIDSFGRRLDNHDNILLKLVGDVQRLIGQSEHWTGKERRKE